MPDPLIAPTAHTHEDRLALAKRITERLHEQHGAHLLAVGIYGSVARGEDGPFSDLEMMAILDEGESLTHEWASGAWKAEVNVLPLDEARTLASALEEEWALTQGQFVHVLPLQDVQSIFPDLKRRVFEHDEAAFNDLLRAIIVGDILELVGKWRNMRAQAHTEALSFIATMLVLHTALLLGAAHRHVFSTATRLFSEALALPDLPEGFAPLCQRVMRGALHETQAVFEECEQLWAGIARWATQRHIALTSDPLALSC